MVNRDSLIHAYQARFGAKPSVMVRAPGRVNLIGEHVDYNGGLVLPIAMELSMYAAAAPRRDRKVVVFSTYNTETVEIDCDRIGKPAADWGAYVQGVIAELQGRGLSLRGANVVVGGDLPVGAGLASSAALEASIALSLLHGSDLSLTEKEIADCCLEAERSWANVPCGMMDQYACMLAKAGQVLLIDCRLEEVRYIPWPRGDATVVIVDSRISHRLSASLYAQRVYECELAWSRFADSLPRIRSLRDVTLARLDSSANELDRISCRRARHVVTEIARVEHAAQALEVADFGTFGDLMNECHTSLAVDYEVSSPQMDELAAIVRGAPGVFGARLMGGGFGGCVVAVARADGLPEIEAAVRARYDANYGVTARVWSTHPCDGATVERLGACPSTISGTELRLEE